MSRKNQQCLCFVFGRPGVKPR